MLSGLPCYSATTLFTLPWTDEAPAVAFIELAAEGEQVPARFMPPCPVIGIGDTRHPLAPQLDMVITDTAEAALIARNCARNPQAAAVLVQLLRMIGSLSVPAALVAESLAYGVLQAGGEHLRWRDAQGALPRTRSAAPTEPGRVLLERVGDGLAVRMDRPGALNAVDRSMRDALREAFDIAMLDPDIRWLTLEGEGRAFSVGADLTEFGTTADPAAAHAIRQRTLPAHALVARNARFEARVHGACVGSGLEMAAFADTIVATPSAWFQLPELAMGLIPGAGGCVSLTRRIGRALTARMVLTGRRIPARTAAEWGLVDRIVPAWDQPSGPPSA